jgi:uncharacterized protein (TIGR02265 family)
VRASMALKGMARIALTGQTFDLDGGYWMPEKPMLADRVVFRQALEGLLKIVPEGRMDAALRHEMLRAGVDLARPLQTAYPMSTWVRFSEVLAAALFPGASITAAHRQLGRRFVEGYFQTFIGKALLPMLKLIGPRRALLRTDRNFRSANNYTEAKFEEKNPSEFIMWINEVDTVPDYTAGIVESGVGAAGAVNPVVEVLSRHGDGCTFRVKWS